MTLHRVTWLTLGLTLLAGLCLASITSGIAEVRADEILHALDGTTETIGEAAVLKRIPRTILALTIGAALALSGATMQAITRNPIADPGILGVSSGASFAVVIGITFIGLNTPGSYMVAAITGAATTAVGVYAIGSLGRDGATPLKLALAGAATTAAFTSLTSAVMLPRVDLLQSFQMWQAGGVGGADWTKLTLATPVIVLAALTCLACSSSMNTLALGDDLATSLGENVALTRLFGATAAIVLAGASVAVAGPIGFVGLIVPHACRLLIGPDHRWLLPMCALVGAGLLLAGDVLGRLVARPQEVDVSIVTALIGAPVFVSIVRRQKVREL